jgi:hypothetical protein
MVVPRSVSGCEVQPVRNEVRKIMLARLIGPRKPRDEAMLASERSSGRISNMRELS